MNENVYANAEDIKFHYKNKLDCTSSRSPGPQLTGPESTGARCYRWVSVCLGLLCVLLLMALIVLTVYYASTHDVQAKYNKLKTERDQQWTNWSSVVAERDQLQTSNRQLSEENKQLQTNYSHCSSSKAQLQKQVCPVGWYSFSSRCYYLSFEEKTWTDSQQFCRQRGANLVIINNAQEQAFIDLFNRPFWIGLSDREREGTWKWVDGTIMPKERGTWRSGQPDDFQQNEDCVETRTTESVPEKRWNDLSCDSALHWICEKDLGS